MEKARHQGFSIIGGPSEEFDKKRNVFLNRQELFVDPTFPPDERSLFYTKSAPFHIVWMRPTEILAASGGYASYGIGPRRVEYPKFIGEGGVQFGELRQGELGDCWVVAALAAMSVHPQLLNRCVPIGQSFCAEWYAGMFCFRFWRFGRWVEVVIDDLLPVGSGGRPLFIHSGRINEFWPALLEKAYAKLNGSYEALHAALIGDAMDDICGGLTESYSISMAEDQGMRPPNDLDDVFIRSFDRHSLITARIKSNGSPGSGFILPVGYVPGQVFALTDCRKLRLTDAHGVRMVSLVRVRNLWPVAFIGWAGAWSEASAEWGSLTPEDRAKVGLVVSAGEFWMSLDDFVTSFDFVDICHLCEAPPSAKMLEQLGERCLCFALTGAWLSGVSAGGRPFNRASHWANPQFVLSLSVADSDDPDGLASCVISLTQADERNLRQRAPKLASIGFVIYKMPTGSAAPLHREFFESHAHCASVDFFLDSREVVKRFRLPLGTYLLVPCTYMPDQAKEFLLRVLFDQDGQSLLPTAEMVELRKFAITGPELDECYEMLQPRVRRLFYELAGERMSVDAFQLEHLLGDLLANDHRAPYSSVNSEACRALVTLMDRNESGRLNEIDFRKMWSILRAWSQFFATCDVQKSRLINCLDFRVILENSGYYLPHRTMAKLVRRFVDADWRITFSQFIQAMSLITKSIALFSQHDRKDVGSVTLNLEQFLDVSLTL